MGHYVIGQQRKKHKVDKHDRMQSIILQSTDKPQRQKSDELQEWTIGDFYANEKAQCSQ